MATLKHSSSKNADCGAPEQYLLFDHAPFTNKSVLNETGSVILREGCRLLVLNCGGGDFSVSCMRANLHCGKNQQRDDVKIHQYIISFGPQDGQRLDHKPDVDVGSAILSSSFSRPASSYLHPPGRTHHSGNIHVHIVINSRRIEEIPFLSYMDRPDDTKVPMPSRDTSKPKSWNCATGRSFTKSASYTAAKNA